MESERNWQNKKLLYFAVWALTVVMFFSLFSQKRAVYILSAYPSIALLFGHGGTDSRVNQRMLAFSRG
jgi:4-amino-4-deoxy-L-arabinose transferase-like glycosyltransferase